MHFLVAHYLASHNKPVDHVTHVYPQGWARKTQVQSNKTATVPPHEICLYRLLKAKLYPGQILQPRSRIREAATHIFNFEGA